MSGRPYARPNVQTISSPKCPSAGRCYGWQVKVGASREALDFIREHGGRLYVWADRRACCGGTRFIRSSTERPGRSEGFALIDHDGVELYVKAAAGRLPDELDIGVRGRRRPRVEAYWNGCAYVV